MKTLKNLLAADLIIELITTGGFENENNVDMTTFEIFTYIFTINSDAPKNKSTVSRYLNKTRSMENFLIKKTNSIYKKEVFLNNIRRLLNDKTTDYAVSKISARFKNVVNNIEIGKFRTELIALADKHSSKTIGGLQYIIETLKCAIENMHENSVFKKAFFINYDPLPNSMFVGRDEEIELIYNSFATQKYVVLNGIGGMGKTELAQQYLARHSKDYDVIIYATFKDNMDETAFLTKCENDSTLQNKDKTSREDAILIKKNTLNSYGSKAIVFIDNLDIDINGQEELDLLFSDYKCRFLVTTRLDFNNAINVSSLSDESLSTLMLSLINQDDTAKINAVKANMTELLCSLNRSTLLVTLVGKMLNSTSEDAEKVIKRIIKSEDFGTEKVEHNRWTRSVSWHIDKLFATDNLSKKQKTMLVLFSLLPDGYYLSEKLIKFWLNHDNLDSIDELIKTGWVSKQNGSFDEEYGVHPLISSVIRKKQLLSKGDYNYIYIGIDGFLSAQLFKDDLSASIPLQSIAISLESNDEKWLNCKSHIIDWLILNGFDKMAYEIYKKSANKNDFNPETYMRLMRFSHIDSTIQISYEAKKQETDKKITVRKDMIALLNDGNENGYKEIFNTDYRIKINHDVETIPIIINTLYGYMKDGDYENLLNSCMILMGLIYPYNSAAAFPLYPAKPDIEEMIDFLENEISKEDIAYTKTHKTVASYSKGKARLKIKGAAFYNNIFLLRKYYSAFCVALHILNTLMDKEKALEMVRKYINNCAKYTEPEVLSCLSIFIINL